MSYIITDTVRLDDEANHSGQRDKVQVRVLIKREGYIKLGVSGEFGEEQARTGSGANHGRRQARLR